MLTEMRGFLIAVRAITEAVTRNDARAIADAARPMGMAAAAGVPATLAAKLPLESGSSVTVCTEDFDRLAPDADARATWKHAHTQLERNAQEMRRLPRPVSNDGACHRRAAEHSPRKFDGHQGSHPMNPVNVPHMEMRSESPQRRLQPAR